MIVKISNGEVHFKEFIDRQTMKLYRKALFVNSKSTIDAATNEPKIEFDMTSMDEANDIIVRGLIEKFVLNGQEVVENIEEVLSKMDTLDFDKLLNEAQKFMKAKEEEKKS